jgi:predicted nucleic acid-binding Zn ribbon protein
MGNTVASRTQSLSVRKKILYVKITSGPLKKELMMNKSKVLALIADKYGKEVISDIVIL